MSPTSPSDGGRQVRVAVASHREILVRGLVAVLSDFPDRVLVTALPNLAGPVTSADVVLYDLHLLQRSSGWDLDHLLEGTGGRVIGVSSSVGPWQRVAALSRGLAGCVSLDLHGAELVDAVVSVAYGEPVAVPDHDDFGLSEREAEILSLICQGHSNQVIAERLVISANTLKTHIRSAYRKIGVSTRAQAVAWATEGAPHTRRQHV